MQQCKKYETIKTMCRVAVTISKSAMQNLDTLFLFSFIYFSYVIEGQELRLGSTSFDLLIENGYTIEVQHKIFASVIMYVMVPTASGSMI